MNTLILFFIQFLTKRFYFTSLLAFIFVFDFIIAFFAWCATIRSSIKWIFITIFNLSLSDAFRLNVKIMKSFFTLITEFVMYWRVSFTEWYFVHDGACRIVDFIKSIFALWTFLFVSYRIRSIFITIFYCALNAFLIIFNISFLTN